MKVPYTAFLLLFDGLICFWAAVRSLDSFRVSGNEYSRMFYRLSVGMGFSFLFYGLTYLFVPEIPIVHGVAYILGAIPLFWGMSFALRTTLLVWGLDRVARYIQPAMTALIVVFVLAHARAIPLPSIRSGVIIRNVPFPFDYIFAAMLFFSALFPVIMFFSESVYGRATFIKKTLLGVVWLLGGIGGIGLVVIHDQFELIRASHFILFGAFVLLVLMYLFSKSSSDY
jgi:hypothetical protein